MILAEIPCETKISQVFPDRRCTITFLKCIAGVTVDIHIKYDVEQQVFSI